MKINKTSKGKNVVANYMGGKSFKQREKEELAFAVVTSFMEDSYYESKDKRVSRITALVKALEEDPQFVAKLAIITRREFHMRSAFHVLLGELTKIHRGDSLVKKTIEAGVERPDDLLEIAAYVGKPIPNQVKKGIALALKKFNEYQLSKYKGDGRSFSLVDLFNLVHPQPGKEQKDTWKKLMVNSGEDKLEAPETWEVKLSSEEGRKDKGAVWKDMVINKKIGYMALLRNLRNILEQADAVTIKEAAKTIVEEDLVLKSKQLPFRFLNAYRELEKVSPGLKFEKEKATVDSAILLKAVERATDISAKNIPALPGTTVILSDNSGSMGGDSGGGSPVSAMSKTKTADIANLFATLYWTRAQDTIVGLFGDRLVLPELDRQKGLFHNFNLITRAAQRCGPGTETGIFDMMKQLIKEKKVVDRIIIFSDMQVGEKCEWYDWGILRGNDFNKLLQGYKRNINPKVMVYSVDLKGYGNTMFSDGVVMLAGWSDKIFELMDIIERKEGLVKWIEDYPVLLQ